MSFSKIDLDKIKNKILLSSEIQKKTKLVKKGKDYWCCCPFHEEKTPSCKINDERGNFYCFGCGAKGDIFTLYTDLYNYNFQEAVKELAKKAGINLKFENSIQSQKNETIKKILFLSSEWFHNNLKNKESFICNEYLKSRNLTNSTIEYFKLGYSYNAKKSLYDFLRENSFKDEDIFKSNIIKLDKNNKVKDYFYKRLIFPIFDERNHVVGFGGRTLTDSNPKYLNSPESDLFIKRNLLFNLNNAKESIRKKNNLLICEGYMDVISLYQKGIKSVVSPLGTALTEDQINLAWKYTSKPTIMFDGDKAGLKASYKSSLMTLPLVSSKKLIQFIILPDGHDPDSYVNSFSFNQFVNLIKKPISLTSFIFNESSKSISLKNADEKILFDKYLDDIIEKIKDNKIKYFYKKEFKSLFFNMIKKENSNNPNKLINKKNIETSLNKKQALSFLATCINNVENRKEISKELLISQLFNKEEKNFIIKISQNPLLNKESDEIKESLINDIDTKIMNECLDSGIYQLFPYSSPDYDKTDSLKELVDSCKNLNTRLLNLKKINKSLDNFFKNSNQLNWKELQNINIELKEDDE